MGNNIITLENWNKYLAEKKAKQTAAENEFKKLQNPLGYALEGTARNKTMAETLRSMNNGGDLFEKQYTNPLSTDYIPQAARLEAQNAEYQKNKKPILYSLGDLDTDETTRLKQEASRYVSKLLMDESVKNQYLKKLKISGDNGKGVFASYQKNYEQLVNQKFRELLSEKYDMSVIEKEAVKVNDESRGIGPDTWKNNIIADYMRLKKYLNPTEEKEYVKIFVSEGRFAADKYLSDKYGELSGRESAEMQRQLEEFSEKYPVLGSVASVGTTLFSIPETLFNSFLTLNTGKVKRSYFADMTTGFRQGVAKKVDWNIGEWDAFDFLYNTGMSAIESVLASYAGGYGAAALGIAAAAQTTNDIIDRGGTDEQAFWGGLAAGAFESVFEKISIGNLKSLKEVDPKTFKDVLLNTAKSMGVNASEEGATETANILWDTFVNGDISNAQLLMQQYKDSGMSEDEAKLRVAVDLGLQIGEAAASGALMGFGFGTGGNIRGYTRNKANDRFNNQTSNIFDTDGREYSIALDVVDTNGNKYDRVVQVNTDLFSGKTEKKKIAAYKNFVTKNLAGNQITLYDTSGNSKVVEFAKENERVKKDGTNNSRKVIDKLAQKKYENSQVAVANSVELVEISFESGQNKDHSHQWLDENGWEFRNSYMQMPNGNIYEVTLNIAKTRDGRNILYDINKIHQVGIGAFSSSKTREAKIPNLMDNGSLPQPAPAVNPDSQTNETPMFSEPDLTTQKPQTLEERTMANIVGGDALLTDGQRRVNSIARLLKMEPVWDVVGDPEVVGKGYYENGVIHLNKQAPALTTVYLHEFCHHLQRSGNWNAFVSFSKSTPVYKQWICEKGGSSDFATAEANYKAQIKKAYESKTGSAYNNTRLTNEIMARFISEKMMVEYASGQNTDLATATEHFLTEIAKNRKWYHIVKEWISEMINRLARRTEQADFLKFQRMLKQAYNDVQSRTATVDTGREWNADDIIDLSKDNELSKEIDNLHGATKYKKIQEYILRVLADQPVTLSDGKKAVVDRSDALHIANKSGDEKTAQISQIKKIVEKAELFAEDTNVEHKKFNYFCYYKAKVKFGTEVFDLFINVGKAENDGTYHIYDITKKIRDTAHRVNDVGRPTSKIEGYALESGVSINSIRDSAENSKENLENREYSFDISDNLPSKLLANDLIADTGSSYDSAALAAEVEKIYAALDEGNKAAAYALANNVADNILNSTENGEDWGNSEVAGKDAAERLANHIVERAQEAEEITLKKAKKENQNLQKKVDGLKKEGGNAELDRKQIRAEEREKLEAAQQRKTNRNVIRKSINRLDKKFRANSNNKHVHDDLKKTIKTFLEIFLDNSPNAFDERNVHKLRTIYSRFVKNQTDLTLDPDTEEKLNFLAEVMENKHISALNDSELQVVRELAEHFEHLVTSANEIFIEGRKENFSSVANEEAERLKKFKDKHELNLGTGKFGKFVDSAKEFLNEGNLKPVYFFDKIGGAYKKLFNDISAGLDKTIKNLKKTTDMLQSIIEKYGYWSWVDKKQKITLGHADGQRITLTLGEAMSVLATYKREKSNKDTQESSHLSQGGIVLKNRQIVSQIEKTANEKQGSFKKLIEHQLITAWASSPFIITEADIKEIREQLGKEKEDFVDELVNIMSTFGAEMGNETSKKLYGYSKFGEPYYFPYETSSLYLQRELDKKQAQKTLTGKSFTKNTVEAANTPLVISDFMEVFCKHMTEMCEYNGLAVPLDNLKRVSRFSERADENKAAFSLTNELNRVYGAATVNYLNKFIEDVDGGIAGQQAGDNIAGSLISLFQKNAVAANLSVVIQQPSSIMRATAYIEPKYLFAKGSKFTNAAWEECQKYNGVAIQKEMGRFDIGNPQSTYDYMMGRQYEGIKEKTKGFVKDENYRDNLLSKAASKADQYTWCTIWNGCKAKIEATTDFEVGSEQFFTEAAKLFKEVIEHTQVYDSVLSRSQNMRSKSVWTRMATAFMGEPTTNLNMLHKAFWDAKAGNMGAATKGVIGVVSATLLNAILKSLITAMRDDDEDKSYGEKYITEVGGNFLSDANPIGWVPIMKDVLSIFEGYQVKRADMNLVQDLYYGLSALSSTKKTTWEKILAVANPISAMCGLPVENIARDIGAVVNTVTNAVNDENEHTHGLKYAAIEGLVGERTYAEYYEILRDKQKKGDTQGYTELKEYLMGRGKTEKEIESGVKAAYSKSKAVAKQTDDYFAKLAQNALFGKLPDEKQEDVKTAVKRYLTESAMNAATGKEMSKTNQKALEAEKKGSSAVNYFLAKAAFEDTDNSGGISNEEKIAAINKMNISALEKQALIMLYTKK